MRLTQFLILAAATSAILGAGPSGAASERERHAGERRQAKAQTPPRARHNRQLDVNDLAGHGVWLGCGARRAAASARESESLASIYCGRPPVFLAGDEPASGAGKAA